MGDRPKVSFLVLLASLLLHASVLLVQSRVGLVRESTPTVTIEFVIPHSADVSALQNNPAKNLKSHSHLQVKERIKVAAHSPRQSIVTNREPSAIPLADDSLVQVTDLSINPPLYPRRCRRARIEGLAEIRVEFRADGAVESATVTKGVEACPEFATVSIQAARSARFLKSATGVEKRAAILPFRFSLNN